MWLWLKLDSLYLIVCVNVLIFSSCPHLTLWSQVCFSSENPPNSTTSFKQLQLQKISDVANMMQIKTHTLQQVSFFKFKKNNGFSGN